MGAAEATVGFGISTAKPGFAAPTGDKISATPARKATGAELERVITFETTLASEAGGISCEVAVEVPDSLPPRYKRKAWPHKSKLIC